MGITPAYAGKTLVRVLLLTILKDHPRLRGENLESKKSLFKEIGSPPPTRGKPELCFVPWIVFRITPAYAGKTQSRRHKLYLC